MKVCKGNRRYIFIIFTVLILLSSISAYSIGGQNKRDNVLILNSYHPSFTWTRQMSETILEEINDFSSDIQIYTEYMDWKNFPTHENIENLYRIYQEKYKNKDIELIITTDDKALEFALEYRGELFSNAPIVFAGVNEDGEERIIKDERDITGVIEHIDLEKTISIALHTNPNIDEFYVIHDQTESGISTYNIVENIIKTQYNDINIVSGTNKSHEEIIDDVSKLTGNSAVIVTTYYKDIRGEPMEFERFCNLLNKISNVPILHMYCSTIGYGNIGGATISAKKHGQQAGKLASRILNGEGADKIPIVRDLPMKIIFDYNQLKKFNVPTSSLPKDAQVINEPFSFVREYKSLVIIALIILIILIVFILVLVFYIMETKRVRDKLEEMTYLDELTGLPNKRTLEKDFHRYFHIEKIKKGALIFLDADNFKLINDTLGHTIGDEFLIEMGKRLDTLSSKSVKLYRTGGDEFVLLIKGTGSREKARGIAHSIMLLLKEGFLIRNIKIHTTASAGVALYPEHGHTFELLSMRSDIAMYKAKEGGKGQYRFFHDKMNEQLIERTSIEKQLRNAIRNNELSLNYQPQYDLKTKGIIGFEALLRWNSKVLGPVSPYKFIKVAEESHTIIPIGKWVLDNACKFIKRIHKLGHSDYTVAVNVSVLQVMQEDFVDMVIDTLASNNLEPRHLEIEMTETMIMENFEILIDKLERLQRSGVRIALDDFGTGYSSLNYLNRLPIDTLKIDKSFIDTISKNGNGKTIINTLIGLGHGMKLKVIAEGVENQEEFTFLKDNNCDFMQGYLLSKPLSEDKVIELLN